MNFLSNYSENYWEQSWQQEDPTQLAQYLENYYQRPNTIVDYFKTNNITHICDAACGFGAYSLLFASNGFTVEGFDISKTSVDITIRNLSSYGIDTTGYKVASILETGYPDEYFEGIVAHAVLDHLLAEDAMKALEELHRITKPDGLIFLSFDALEEEDLQCPHTVLPDGSLQYTEGERNSMIFHPYNKEKIFRLLQGRNIEKILVRNEAENIVILRNRLKPDYF